MAATTVSRGVELGFVETVDSWRLSNYLFPSKVGGKPVWLSLRGVPNAADLQCPLCQKPCVFLCQVYAPLPPAECFHRTIFLFFCRDAACCRSNDSSNFIALRCQLPKVNEFYDELAPDDEAPLSEGGPRADRYQAMCVVCGCAGGKRCGKCHSATYCSRTHQTVHWKDGHKASCGQQGQDEEEAASSCSLLLPEYELVTEPEDYEKPAEKSESEKMREYAAFMASPANKELLLGKKAEEDLWKMATSDNETDREFCRFRKRTQHEPDQVVRYQRGGEVLWVAERGKPADDDVPHCSCGAQRQFEFQVLPQMLNHLRLDATGGSTDWGTLAVYACTDSCDGDATYRREFVWKQDIGLPTGSQKSVL